MGAPSATGIIDRREWEAAADPGAAREALAGAHAGQHLGAEVAAASFVDEVIEPGETRARLVSALGALCGRGSPMPPGWR
jgi:acetyl-CoA carboxylase carboxyltransferase component